MSVELLFWVSGTVFPFLSYVTAFLKLFQSKKIIQHHYKEKTRVNGQKAANQKLNEKGRLIKIRRPFKSSK